MDLAPLLGDALRALDVQNLTLSIHDASFPGDPDEDVGRGSPCSRGALRFLGFVRGLGFTGVQLGPDGETPADDPSPYRGSAFPRSVLSIALAPLAEDPAWDGLLPARALEDAVAARPAGALERADHVHALAAHARALDAAFARWTPTRLAEERRRFEEENAHWLARYELFHALARHHGTGDIRRWNGDAGLWCPDRDGKARRRAIRSDDARGIAYFRFIQLVADVQRRQLAATAAGLGLRLFGDLPIGLSAEDEWCWPELFLERWRMGAPPSRTTPGGQAWGYPVFDPRRSADGAGPGTVRHFFEARLAHLLAGVDGVRVDHPHGLVCPWVYDAGTGDDARAVREGARLFESPDHPDLRRFAVARATQLNPDPRTPRHADDWVTDLEPRQVDAYAVLLEAIVAAVHRHGGGTADVVCEVLSTLPTPLARVLARLGLGRFRVTQKAVLSDPHDVYRSENARPEDWMMVGTHDTPPIWAVVEGWREGERRERAAYLAWRLSPREEEREDLARRLAANDGLLVHAQFADLFASPARNVMVFFADLFGLTESYNVPGTVGAENWSLRVPPAWADGYAERLGRDRALNLPLALAMAVRARAAGNPVLGGLDLAAEAYRHAGRPVAVS